MDILPADPASPDFWEAQYKRDKQGWDLGYVSPPLKAYIDQLNDKTIRILVPGAGQGWEVKYLYEKGFHNVFYLDFSAEAVNRFKKNCPDFPCQNIINADFFQLNSKYDLVLEQTFLSSFAHSSWEKVAKMMYQILSDKGKYVGLFFNHDFYQDLPPFAAQAETYYTVFEPYFSFRTFKTAYNSIKPRSGREIFFILQKN